MAQYCSEKDGNGNCFWDTITTTCSVTKFMELSGTDIVNTDMMQKPYFRPEKLLKEYITVAGGRYTFYSSAAKNSPCEGGICYFTYEGPNDNNTCGDVQKIGPYNFCDEGCGSYHVTHFGKTVCGNRDITGTDSNGNVLRCDAKDGSSTYYRDAKGNIHEWSLKEIN